MNLLLNGLVRINVIRNRFMDVPRKCQHSRMLAGAIVVKRRRPSALGTQALHRYLIKRHVRATQQVGFTKTNLVENGPDEIEMNGFATVRAGDDGEFSTG